MAVGGITDRQKPAVLSGGKRAFKRSLFFVYATGKRENITRPIGRVMFSSPYEKMHRYTSLAEPPGMKKCTGILASQSPRRAHWIKRALSSELDKILSCDISCILKIKMR